MGLKIKNNLFKKNISKYYIYNKMNNDENTIGVPDAKQIGEYIITKKLLGKFKYISYIQYLGRGKFGDVFEGYHLKTK